MIGSYGSIYALGHKAVADIFLGKFEVTEKVDGSQISFGIVDDELQIRSKGQQLHLGADNGMFNLAVEKIQEASRGFVVNWIYRGEYLMRPKHNTLAYERVPYNNIMIYDVECGPGTEDYLTWRQRYDEALRIGFEPIPTIAISINGEVTLDTIKEYLNLDSVLGGVKIEGVVVKNYEYFTADKRVARAKFVSDSFKEKHVKEWKKGNPTQKDIVQELIDELKTEARWMKSVQHMRENGRLDGSPRDIGPLIKETQEDILREEEDYIKDKLFKHFKGQISRGAVSGLPEWFKLKLAEGEI